MDSIDLAQDGDRWMRGISWLAEDPLDSEEGLRSMKLVS